MKTSDSLSTSETLQVKQYSYVVLDKISRDHNSFTQGLVYQEGFFYESVGKYGNSKLKKIDSKSGLTLAQKSLDSRFFAEGITIFQNEIFCLTWKSHVAMVFSLDNFNLLKKIEFSKEGWGITHDQKYLITSDGSSYLYFVDPHDFSIVRQIQVVERDPVSDLNELEYIEGRIYANVWKKSKIVIIEPQTGKVFGWVSLLGLMNKKELSALEEGSVLNGIAYHKDKRTLFVTGKNWPYIFEIKIVEI